MDKFHLPIFLGLLLFLQVPAFADIVSVINFDDLNDSDIVTNQYPGLTFANTIVLSAGISLNEFEFPPHSGNNVVSDNGGPISILFRSPVLSFGGYFTYQNPLTLAAFDGLDDQVVTATSAFSSNDALFGDLGSSPNEFLAVSSLNGISRVTITGDLAGGSFVADDATFQAGNVPEPASMSLLLSGAVAVLTLRRKALTMRQTILIGAALLVSFVLIREGGISSPAGWLRSGL